MAWHRQATSPDNIDQIVLCHTVLPDHNWVSAVFDEEPSVISGTTVLVQYQDIVLPQEPFLPTCFNLNPIMDK